MTPAVRLGSRGGFDTLELDSPANRNALSIDMLTAAVDAVARSAAASSRGLLLTHSGSAFCSGVDLRERQALGADDTSHSRLLADLIRTLWHYPQPVVASVDGAVRGGGLGILACADVVLATPRSTFAYSEARVGVAPALVMAVTLPLVPSRGLMPRLLDGAVFDAEAAIGMGLVTRVVDGAGEDLDAVLAELRRGAPGAQAAIKRLARQWDGSDMDDRIEEMTVVSADLFAGTEAAEGMAAFTAKRAPSWAVLR